MDVRYRVLYSPNKLHNRVIIMKPYLEMEIVSFIGLGNKWELKEIGGTTHRVGSQEHYLGLKGTNTGQVPIRISSWGFELPNTNYITEVPVKVPELVHFPFTLLPGKSVHLTKLYSAIAGALKNGGYPETTTLIGIFREENRTEHRITGLPFNQYQ